MDELIRIATRELVAFLCTHLPTLGPQWWTTHVEERLTHRQRQRLRERGHSRLDQLDFAALVRIVDRNWFELSQTANLPREGRDWVRELQSVRNRLAHASAEQEASEDVFRDADTLGRCLGMIGAGPDSIAAVEAVKSTALRKMAAAQSAPETPSEPTPARTKAVPEGTQARPTGSVATMEVRDNSLWTSHIRGDDALKAMLNGLRGQSQIELEVDGFHGRWQKMDDGRDGRATTGLKPVVGPAKAHWDALLRDKLGSLVTIALVSTAHADAMGRDEQSFVPAQRLSQAPGLCSRRRKCPSSAFAGGSPWQWGGVRSAPLLDGTGSSAVGSCRTRGCSVLEETLERARGQEEPPGGRRVSS